MVHKLHSEGVWHIDSHHFFNNNRCVVVTHGAILGQHTCHFASVHCRLCGDEWHWVTCVMGIQWQVPSCCEKPAEQSAATRNQGQHFTIFHPHTKHSTGSTSIAAIAFLNAHWLHWLGDSWRFPLTTNVGATWCDFHRFPQACWPNMPAGVRGHGRMVKYPRAHVNNRSLWKTAKHKWI